MSNDRPKRDTLCIEKATHDQINDQIVVKQK